MLKIKTDKITDLEKFGFKRVVNGDVNIYYFHFSDSSYVLISIVKQDKNRDCEKGLVELDWVDFEHIGDLVDLIYKLTKADMVDQQLSKKECLNNVNKKVCELNYCCGECELIDYCDEPFGYAYCQDIELENLTVKEILANIDYWLEEKKDLFVSRDMFQGE